LAGCRKVVGLDGCFFKERRREPQEKPKGRRLSKRGTVIRCRKCKTGHNRSTCDRRNSGTSNMGGSPPNVQPAQSQSNVQPAQSQAHVNSLNAMVWTDTSSIYSQVPFHDMYISIIVGDLICMYTGTFASFTTECHKWQEEEGSFK